MTDDRSPKEQIRERARTCTDVCTCKMYICMFIERSVSQYVCPSGSHLVARTNTKTRARDANRVIRSRCAISQMRKRKKQRNPKCVAKHKMKKYINYVVFFKCKYRFFVCLKKAEKLKSSRITKKTKLSIEHSDEDRERDVILR